MGKSRKSGRELKTVSKRIEAEERFPEEQKAKLSLYNFIT